MWSVYWKNLIVLRFWNIFLQCVSQNMNMTSFCHVRFPDMSVFYRRKQMMCAHCDGDNNKAEAMLAYWCAYLMRKRGEEHDYGHM